MVVTMDMKRERNISVGIGQNWKKIPIYTHKIPKSIKDIFIVVNNIFRNGYKKISTID
jgi:hypothetical protein